MSIRTLHVQYVGNNLHIHDWHERDVAAITTNDGREWVPIVRCRDCEHNVHGACAHWDYCDIDGSNGFCAWAERRGGE